MKCAVILPRVKNSIDMLALKWGTVIHVQLQNWTVAFQASSKRMYTNCKIIDLIGVAAEAFGDIFVKRIT